MAEAAGVLYGLETLVEGAVAFAKGIYDPTLPLKAAIREIKDVKVESAYASLSVVKGRGYVFGGVVAGEVGRFLYFLFSLFKHFLQPLRLLLEDCAYMTA